LQDINAPKDNRIYVLEISSFQMEFTHHFRPHVSVFLNISPDHLDRHADMDEYVNAKLKMAEHQTADDFIVYNLDDAILSSAFNAAAASAYPFSLGPNGKIFGLNETKIFDEEHATLIDLERIALPGRHNLANQLAAASAAHLLGVDHSRISRVMETFAGVEHRLETVMDIKGVTYINDSKATNVDAVNVALESLSTPTILILGGINKGGDFTILLPHTHNHLKEVIAFGQARNQIQTAVGDAVRFTSVENLIDAVSLGHAHAESGYSVLLSPGCSSFDQFQNFEERGDMFKQAVAQLEKSA
jgi:UDP-N-acetylmuramoylalanine--D-glutamate ligase